MNDTIGTITIVVAALTLLVGLVVILRNPRSRLHESLFLTSVFFSLWMVANFYSNDLSLDYDQQLLMNRLIFVFSAGAMGWVFIFFGDLTQNTRFLKHRSLFLLFTVVLMLTCATPLVVSDIIPMLPVTEVVFGPIAILYFAALLFDILASIWILIIEARKSSGITKARLQIVGWTTVVTLVLAFTTNALLPFVFGSYDASIGGPVFFSIMIAGFAYAIVRHRLFDVRLVAVRSFAYLCAITVLAAVYVLLVITITEYVLGDAPDSTPGQLATALLAIPLLFVFQPLRGFFDQVTTKLFYRSVFNPQTVIDEFSTSLVYQTSYQQINDNSIHILNEALKPFTSQLWVSEKRSVVFRGHHGKRPNSNPSLMSLRNLSEELTVIDELPSSDTKRDFAKHNIGIVSRLSSDQEELGYLILSGKKNGDIYRDRDIEVVRIASHSLSIALDNARKYEQIESFNEELIGKIDKATAKLKLSNAELKELHRAKDDFISAASHQLKPQLSVAKGLVELLQDEDPAKLSDRDEILKNTSRSIDRMTRIVSDILEKSLTDTGHVALNVSKCDLLELAEDEYRAAIPEAQKKKIEISLSSDVSSMPVRVDSLKIREVLANVIRNAIEYTRHSGSIEIVVSNSNDQAQVMVHDTGIGIPKEEMHGIGQKFYRASNSIDVRPDGTGIGLYVARGFVEAHGGRLIVSSKEGQGSSIGISVPITTD